MTHELSSNRLLVINSSSTEKLERIKQGVIDKVSGQDLETLQLRLLYGDPEVLAGELRDMEGRSTNTFDTRHISWLNGLITMERADETDQADIISGLEDKRWCTAKTLAVTVLDITRKESSEAPRFSRHYRSIYRSFVNVAGRDSMLDEVGVLHERTRTVWNVSGVAKVEDEDVLVKAKFKAGKGGGTASIEHSPIE